MADFEKCINWVLKLEDSKLTGVIKDLGDGGGLTRFGITQHSNPNVEPTFWTTMPFAEALDLAKRRYRAIYWNVMKGDFINCEEVAAVLLSFVVNDGPFRAIREIQTALGRPDIVPDGHFGPKTLAAVNAAEPVQLARDLRDQQIAFYRREVEYDPRDEKYLKGWINRANAPYPS